ncbi:Outer membrane lipoprotein carrier protein LolA [Pseudoalteromonas luteoviolacea B = ATCC 29581]|nr:Outer membrane lipoprotein carrier protein LolA [Pseudoalteromonas luteoviolacea B = ATCC 29581]
MKWITKALSTIALLMSSDSIANQIDAVNLKAKLNNMRTYSADFIQVVRDLQGKLVLEGQGHLLLESPLKMRWAQKQPDDTLFVSNGKYGFYFDSFAEQVTIMDSVKLVTQTPFVLLTSMDEVHWSQYTVTQKNNSFVITPIVKEAQQVEKLEVAFSNEGILSSVKLTDLSGQRATYSFSKPVVNEPIDPILFTFEIPKGVFIDDQTQSD